MASSFTILTQPIRKLLGSEVNMVKKFSRAPVF